MMRGLIIQRQIGKVIAQQLNIIIGIIFHNALIGGIAQHIGETFNSAFVLECGKEVKGASFVLYNLSRYA